MYEQERSSVDRSEKEIEIMKRITLILGVVAVMVTMLVALAAPAMAKDNGGGPNNGGGKANSGHSNGGINRPDNRPDNRLDNRLDRMDNRVALDDGDFLVSDFSPLGLVSNINSVSDPAISDPGFVSDVTFDPIDPETVDFDSGIDNVDFGRNIDFATGNNHNGNAAHSGNAHHSGSGNGNHSGGGGHKGNGK